jgi:hypothetical protein
MFRAGFGCGALQIQHEFCEEYFKLFFLKVGGVGGKIRIRPLGKCGDFGSCADSPH